MAAPARLFVDPRRPSRLAPEILRPLRQRLAQHVEASVLGLLDPDRLQALTEDLRAIEKARASPRVGDVGYGNSARSVPETLPG